MYRILTPTHIAPMGVRIVFTCQSQLEAMGQRLDFLHIPFEVSESDTPPDRRDLEVKTARYLCDMFNKMYWDAQ